jgi:S1-C subfamily serine protease
MQPSGCGVYITDVMKGSPAERAGLKPGDRIRAIDGRRVENNSQAAEMLRGDRPDKVRVRIVRGGREFEAVVTREESSEILARAGKKLVSGVLVPPDFTGTWISTRVFPWGYPVDTTLFYPGFELLVVPDAGRSTIDGLVIRGTLQVIVGDVPPGGPAALAGVQPGDTIVSVNGVAPSGKSGEELQRMFSSHEPGTLHLELKRGAETRDVDVPLAPVPQVARASGKRIVNGIAVPAWLLDGSTGCRPH